MHHCDYSVCPDQVHSQWRYDDDTNEQNSLARLDYGLKKAVKEVLDAADRDDEEYGRKFIVTIHFGVAAREIWVF